GVYFITQGALQTKLVNVSIIYSTIVFFSYLYSIVLLKNKVSIKLIGLILLSFLGTAFIAANSFFPTIGKLGVGDLYVLLSAATMAAYSVGRQMLSKDLNNQEITIVTMLIAGVSGIILAIISGEHLNISSLFNYEVLIGLAIGIFFNIVSTFLGNYSFEHLDVVVGNQLLLTESIFSIVIGYILYHEILTVPEVVGAIIVIISVIFGIKLINNRS
ncbi:MAG TPA: DMT family transporter, partial [Candidatus Dojkabacteria bacterium]|nr:DMT family transporter [Candidatus Dojkabacteria bacterium]